MADLSSKFTQFQISATEKVCTAIDRLNGIVQKLARHNRAPMADAKLAKLKEALNIPELGISITLLDNPTFTGVVLLEDTDLVVSSSY